MLLKTTSLFLYFKIPLIITFMCKIVGESENFGQKASRQSEWKLRFWQIN